MKLFVDTWGWVTLADRRQPRHRVATEFYNQRMRTTGLIVTSNFVLDELFTMLFATRPFDLASSFCNSLLASPRLSIEFVNPNRFAAAFQFRLKLVDKPKISFTDITSMVIMRELGIVDVMTADSHFQQVNLGFRSVPE